MRVLDLFSGIGGFSLGLEAAGMTTVAFCEIEPYCQAVLRKHWPEVPIHEDITELSVGHGFADLICGGFPCQDISLAGKGAGIDGARSGLWGEYARLIGECSPTWAIIENVPALRSRGFDRVLRDLAALGYDAGWHCIPACAIGAPHRRDRIWIVAHTNGEGLQDGRQARQQASESQEIGEVAQSKFERCGYTWWETEPNVGRVADGVPRRLDRIKALGNSIVPQMAHMIGRSIMDGHDRQRLQAQG